MIYTPWALVLGLSLGLESQASGEPIHYWTLMGPMSFQVIDGLVSGLPLDLKSEDLDLDLNWVIGDFGLVLEVGAAATSIGVVHHPR